MTLVIRDKLGISEIQDVQYFKVLDDNIYVEYKDESEDIFVGVIIGAED